MRHSALARHPATPCPAVRGIDVRVSQRPDGGLSLTYTLAGELAHLCLPAPAAPARADGLWRHTCFEAFVMAGDGPGYREFNFSPAGEWAAYAFTGYRAGGPLEPVPAPVICCHGCDSALELEARLAPSALPAGGPLRLGLSAVIEAADGRLSYWALRHPPGQPDFHHTEGFALLLDLP